MADVTLSALIVGLRVKYPTSADAPFFDASITEKWQWKTDLMRAVDGSEQRVALRQSPRINLNIKKTFFNAEQIRQYRAIVESGGDYQIVAEWHYGTTLEDDAPSGTRNIVCNHKLTDIRDGEVIGVWHPSIFTRYITVERVTALGCLLANPLSTALPAGTIIAPASVIFARDGLQFGRGKVANHGQMSLSGMLMRERKAMTLTPETLDYASDGLPIIDMPTLADDTLTTTYDTGQIVFDNEIGLVSSLTHWKYPKGSTELNFIVGKNENCLKIGNKILNKWKSINYWKTFCDFIKGSSKPFYWFTNSAEVLINEFLAKDKVVLNGSYFYETFSKLPSGIYLGLVDSNNLKSTWKIASVSLDAEDNSVLDLDLPAPDTFPYVQASLVRKVRIVDDEVTLTHDKDKTTISFTVIDTDKITQNLS